jgi:hypothetical protein
MRQMASSYGLQFDLKVETNNQWIPGLRKKKANVFPYRVRHIGYDDIQIEKYLEFGSMTRDKLSCVSKTSYESVKELLDVSNSGRKVANVTTEISHSTCKFIHATIEITHTTCNVSHASGEVTQLGSHATEGTFDHCQTLLGRKGFILRILGSQTAN